MVAFSLGEPRMEDEDGVQRWQQYGDGVGLFYALMFKTKHGGNHAASNTVAERQVNLLTKLWG